MRPRQNLIGIGRIAGLNAAKAVMQDSLVERVNSKEMSGAA
jgi:hypothetical protein